MDFQLKDYFNRFGFAPTKSAIVLEWCGTELQHLVARYDKNAMKHSVKLVFVPMEDNMCHVSWFDLHWIKGDSFKEIPNKMSGNDAIEELKSLDSCDDIEERHRRADEILLSVISNYCPNGSEIVDSFISLNKNY